MSGSRWGETVTLVEELAIGHESGAEPYLFGTITAAWATDERIYVVDAQVPVVRAFDIEGRHITDIGAPGQGPGEYNRPVDLVVTDDGRVAVADATEARLTFFDADGEFLDSWALPFKSGLGLVLGHDGEIWAESWSVTEERFGLRPVGPGASDETFVFPPVSDFEPPSIALAEGLALTVPFAPRFRWAFAASGAIVAGVGDTYRFEIRRPDGTTTVVEKAWEPVAVRIEEAEFHAARARRGLRRISPDPRVSAADLPATKPAFVDLLPDRSGRLWVVREGRGRRDPDCRFADRTTPALTVAGSAKLGVDGKNLAAGTPAPEGACWMSTIFFELFDVRTGELLGSIEAPEPGFRRPLFAEGEVVLAAIIDELGTVRMVKYRLQLG